MGFHKRGVNSQTPWANPKSRSTALGSIIHTTGALESRMGGVPRGLGLGPTKFLDKIHVYWAGQGP